MKKLFSLQFARQIRFQRFRNKINGRPRQIWFFYTQIILLSLSLASYTNKKEMVYNSPSICTAYYVVQSWNFTTQSLAAKASRCRDSELSRSLRMYPPPSPPPASLRVAWQKYCQDKYRERIRKRTKMSHEDAPALVQWALLSCVIKTLIQVDANNALLVVHTFEIRDPQWLL